MSKEPIITTITDFIVWLVFLLSAIAPVIFLVQAAVLFHAHSPVTGLYALVGAVISQAIHLSLRMIPTKRGGGKDH